MDEADKSIISLTLCIISKEQLLILVVSIRSNLLMLQEINHLMETMAPYLELQ
jgi:hypothetical protein